MNTFKFLLLSILFLSFTSFSQSLEWSLFKTINGVNIYTKDATCIFKNGDKMNQNVVLFKIENTTNNKLLIEWDLRVWYNGEEAVNNITEEENHIAFNITSNASIKGDTALDDRNLYLYKKFTDFKNSKEMTKFQLDNLKVSIVK